MVKWKLWMILPGSGWFAYGLNNEKQCREITHSIGFEPEPSLLVNSDGAFVVDMRLVESELIDDNAASFDLNLSDGIVQLGCGCEISYTESVSLDTTMMFSLDVFIKFIRRMDNVLIGRVNGLKVDWEEPDKKPIL